MPLSDDQLVILMEREHCVHAGMIQHVAEGDAHLTATIGAPRGGRALLLVRFIRQIRRIRQIRVAVTRA